MSTRSRSFFWRLALAVLAGQAAALLAACDLPAEREMPSDPPFVEAGDLQQIAERRTLRILLPRPSRGLRLPRGENPLELEDRLADAYAASMGLRPFRVYVESRDELIPALLAGRGDLVTANLTVTDERKREAAFTVPVTHVREQLVARAVDDSIRSPQDLIGRRVHLRRSSSFWGTVEALAERYPGIEIVEAPEGLDIEEIVHRVATGRYDLTVADSNMVQAILRYRDDVRPVLDLTPDRPIAWALRPRSRDLLRSLNRFLTDQQLARRAGEPFTGDLAEIKRRGVLRMLTRNGAATYFLWRGELVGFEYELVGEFARQQGLRLEVVVAPSREELVPWLLEGRGDLVAAAVTPTDDALALGTAYSRPYGFVSQTIVARADDPVDEPGELANRKIVVRRSSKYWPALETLQASGIALELVPAPEEMEAEELIARVATGEFDLTAVDSHMLDIELTWRNDVRAAFALSEESPLAWAVRAGNSELLAAVDAFLTREYRGLAYNVLYNRYFVDSRRIRWQRRGRLELAGGISPYDDLARRFAEKYGFDWRLIVAVMYQESRFDPAAESFAGALGLLQVLPQTAEEFGFPPDRIVEPEIGIHAGVRYLEWLWRQFEDELAVNDRMWFSLAAYNAGLGHVRQARRVAARQGLDPNRWFDDVERAMLLLSRPQYAEESPYGYCRCNEPVNYVRAIRDRYLAYLESTGQQTPRRAAL